MEKLSLSKSTEINTFIFDCKPISDVLIILMFSHMDPCEVIKVGKVFA